MTLAVTRCFGCWRCGDQRKPLVKTLTLTAGYMKVCPGCRQRYLERYWKQVQV